MSFGQDLLLDETLWILEEALTSLTLLAYQKCETNGVYGLTWEEIEKCEEEFCSILTVPCPTKEDYESFDENSDGNLSLDEYFNHTKNMPSINFA